MDNLHSGSRWIYRIGSYKYLVIIGVFLLPIIFRVISVIFNKSNEILSLISITISIMLIIFISEIYTRMSYNRFLYELTNEEIKIEQGIIWKKYTSIPYERIQNIDIQRGIIARIFGFSTIQIETAGQSGLDSYYKFGFGKRGNKQYKSEGYLPAIGINEAEQIKEFIIKKIKQTNNRGL